MIFIFHIYVITSSMKPYGACRACLVEVEMPDGRKMTVASCTTPAGDSMKVQSDNESVNDLRKVL